jgi:hypothetical protein
MEYGRGEQLTAAEKDRLLTALNELRLSTPLESGEKIKQVITADNNNLFY